MQHILVVHSKRNSNYETFRKENHVKSFIFLLHNDYIKGCEQIFEKSWYQVEYKRSQKLY